MDDDDPSHPLTHRRDGLYRLWIDDPATRDEIDRFDHEGHPDLRWGDYPKLLRKPSSRLYGAYIGDRLVARMWLIVASNSEGLGRRPQLRLHLLEVLAGYRHLGLGSLLVRFSQRLGLPIAVDVLPGAEAFYLKLGFVPTDRTGKKRNHWGEQTFVWLPGQPDAGQLSGPPTPQLAATVAQG
ncbi:MAG TPA: GNAT family N-acetyltransferase [Limnochorda sp.]